MADLRGPQPRRALRWRLAWPKPSADFVREMLAGHSALGLALGGLIYLVCVTGTLDVFVSDLRAWEHPRPRVAVNAAFLETALAEARTRAGKDGSVYLMSPRMEAGRARLEVFGAGDEMDYALDPGGHIVGELKTPFTAFVDRTHMYLSLPPTIGLVVVGLIGAALLSLLLSGVLAHPRIFRDAFTLRWGGSKRLQEADLHNRLSVWGLPFHLAITLTGVFFGLASLLVFVVAAAAYKGDTVRVSELLGGPSHTHDARSAPLPPIGPMLQQLGISQDPGRVNYVGVEHMGTRGSQISLEIAAQGRLPRGETHYFDADGHYLGPAGYAEGPVGKQAYAAAASLHFGTFGGFAVRLAYGVLGVALCVICAGGVAIWAARRRDQGRPAPRIERLWLGMVWGVPTALCVTGAVALGTDVSPLAVFWAALALTAGGALAQPDRQAASRLGRATLAISLAAVAIIHAVKFRAGLDLEGVAVDSLCLIGAIGLGLSLLRDIVPAASAGQNRQPDRTAKVES